MSAWGRLGRRAGIAGAAVGVVAAGAAAGLAAERFSVSRRRLAQDQRGAEPYGGLRGRPVTVVADDGAVLSAEVDGDEAAELTVVFVHGYALSSDCWHYQRKAFRDRVRLVFYDQRGHGRSGDGPRDHRTIDQLGDDLSRVLDAVAADGPVVLVGHSMGGMTVMSLAERRPQLFADRVVGVALLSTSAGRLADVMLGVPALGARVLHRVAPRVLDALARRGELVERGRRLGSDIGYLMTKRYSYASEVPAPLVEFTARMIEGTPIDVIADFFPAFAAHDKLDALDVLDGIETLVLVGEQDLMTPADHSRDISRALPAAELVVVPNAGHMVILEHPGEVNRHLADLVTRASRGLARGGSVA